MKKLLYFATGAALGSFVTWKLLKDKYEKLANEEIESVKEALSKKGSKNGEKNTEVTSSDEEDVETEFDEETIEEYHNLTNTYIKDYNTDEKEESYVKDKPYVLDESDFGMFDEYDTVTLHYYADDVLADDLDILVDNPEETVGDVKSYFENTDDDIVYVRNEVRECDYEILKCHDKFSELYQ